MISKLRNIVILFLLLIIFGVAIFAVGILIGKNILLSDERDSYEQIILFTKGNTLSARISSVRGYHLLLAWIIKIFNNGNTSFLRYAALCINLLLLPVFYLTAKSCDPKNAISKTFQIVFLPILFPFIFLMYPDILSLSMVVFSFFLVLKKRYTMAGFFIIMSMLIKQNNVIWLLFINSYIYFQENGWNLKGGLIWQHIKRSVIYLLGAAIFMIFVFINKGLVLGQKNMHPLAISNLGNIYFLLFIFFFLFLPQNIINFRKIILLVYRRKWLLVFAVFWFVIFMTTFFNIHPYNQSGYYLRNQILVFFTNDTILKIYFYLIAVYAAFSALVTKMRPNIAALLFIAVIILLIPVSLIEQRYYLIPFAFYILLKEEGSIKTQVFTIFLYIICSLCLTSGILSGQFFL